MTTDPPLQPDASHQVRCCVCNRLLFKMRGLAGSLVIEHRCGRCSSLLEITRGRFVAVLAAAAA